MHVLQASPSQGDWLGGTEVQLRGHHCYKCDDSDSSDSDYSDDSDNSNDRSSEKNGPAHRTT